MARETIDNLLALGQEAARRGDDALALKYLHEVVEEEPENETAWLWLSAVVPDEANKRICLENVLVLNPESSAAKRGLQRLLAAKPVQETPPEGTIQRSAPPLSPAAAILYPERQNKSWRWHDPIELQQGAVAGYSKASVYQDVWEGDKDLCPYCAAELGAEDQRCPSCRRNLVTGAFRYPKSSTNLTIYIVLILAVFQIYLALLLANLLSLGSPSTLAWQTLMVLMTGWLALGLAFRRFWAYVSSIVVLLLAIAAILIGRFLGPALDESVVQVTGREFFLTLSDKPFVIFGGPIIDFLQAMQYLVLPIALLYALFRVGPDFERVSGRRVAQVERGISDASRFYGVGRDYAEQGMWASAALHYQRAAALEPGRAYYQRALGEAYGRLGHYQRCLDVLESARQLTRAGEARAAIEDRIAEVQLLAAEQATEQATPGIADNGS